MLRQIVEKPAPAASMATRSPAKPAPTHNKSVMIVSKDILSSPFPRTPNGIYTAHFFDGIHYLVCIKTLGLFNSLYHEIC